MNTRRAFPARAATAIILLLALATSGYAGGQRARDAAMPSTSAATMEGGDKMMAEDKMGSDLRMAPSAGGVDDIVKRTAKSTSMM